MRFIVLVSLVLAGAPLAVAEEEYCDESGTVCAYEADETIGEGSCDEGSPVYAQVFRAGATVRHERTTASADAFSACSAYDIEQYPDERERYLFAAVVVQSDEGAWWVSFAWTERAIGEARDCHTVLDASGEVREDLGCPVGGPPVVPTLP